MSAKENPKAVSTATLVERPCGQGWVGPKEHSSVYLPWLRDMELQDYMFVLLSSSIALAQFFSVSLFLFAHPVHGGGGGGGELRQGFIVLFRLASNLQ